MKNFYNISISIYISCLIVFASCSIQQEKKQENQLVNQDSTSRVESKPKMDVKRLVDKAMLDGVWWLPDDEISALFYIENDSLYYVEMQDSPSYLSMSSDTLFLVHQQAITKMLVVKLSADTLIIRDLDLRENTLLIKK